MSHPALTLAVRVERWPIAGSFTISRGAKTEAVVVVAELSDGSHHGRGECVPYARYGETVERVTAAIEAMRRSDRERPRPRSACRPRCRRARRATRSTVRSGTSRPRRTAVRFMSSLGLAPPARRSPPPTRSRSHRPTRWRKPPPRRADRALLKVKLGGARRSRAHRRGAAAAPRAELIVDANEAWTPDNLAAQPRRLRAGRRHAGRAAAARRRATTRSRRSRGRFPICADESVHDQRIACHRWSANTTRSTSSSTRPAG